MPDDSLNNGRRTLGVIDGTLTQLSLGVIGLAPTLACVLVRPDLLRAQIYEVQEQGRRGVLLAPGPFFAIGLFAGLITASLAASRADGALIAMGADVARDMPDGGVALSTSAEVYEADDRRAKALKKMYFKL